MLFKCQKNATKVTQFFYTLKIRVVRLNQLHELISIKVPTHIIKGEIGGREKVENQGIFLIGLNLK